MHIIPKLEVPIMNETAKKFIDLFRQAETAAAADAQGHPQARIISVMRAAGVEFCPASAIDRLYP